MDVTVSRVELVLLVGGLSVVSITAGIVAGLLGVGGGVVIVPVLSRVFTFMESPEELQMHMAVATSLAMIILPFAGHFVRFGARLAQARKPIWIKRACAVFLAPTAIKVLQWGPS